MLKRVSEKVTRPIRAEPLRPSAFDSIYMIRDFLPE
jgi:hypothetical protein